MTIIPRHPIRYLFLTDSPDIEELRLFLGENSQVLLYEGITGPNDRQLICIKTFNEDTTLNTEYAVEVGNYITIEPMFYFSNLETTSYPHRIGMFSKEKFHFLFIEVDDNYCQVTF